MKIRPVAAEVFHAKDGRSDKHDEAVFFFSKFRKCTGKMAPVANRTIRTEIFMTDVQHRTALHLAGIMFGPWLWDYNMSRDSSVGVARLATGWTVRRSNPGGGENFRTRPDQPCGPLSLLYNGYRFFPGGKEAG